MFKRTWHIRALAGLSLLFSTLAMASSQPEAVPGEFVVQLKSDQMRAQSLHSLLGSPVKRWLRPGLALIQRPASETRAQTLEALAHNSAVVRIEPNYIYHASKTPNNPDYNKQWGLKNNGQADSEGHVGRSEMDIDVARAWDITTGSSSTVVAVIDTGIDRNNPNLKNNMWANLTELNGKSGVDDDSNGFVDDVYGWNFAANKADPLDDNGHGTHCAGVIGAEGDSGVGIAGINWQVKIMAVKFLDAEGSGTLAAAIQSIDYATKMGARVLSNSWGGGPSSQLLQDAITRSRDANALFIAAAGNDGQDNDSTSSFPSNYPLENIIAVAAIDNTGHLADFSNYGHKLVHIAAPGVNIYSTVLGNKYESWSGTSMATPHVSGAAALVWSHDPQLSALDIKQRLLNFARPISYLRGKVATAGMVDVYYALTSQQPPKDMNDPVNWTQAAYTLSTPHPYVSRWKQTYTVQVPGAPRFAVHFAKFETERTFDKVEFFNSKGNKLGEMTGSNDDAFSPVVDGDTMIIRVSTDDSVNKYGFDVDSVAVQM